MSQTSNITVNRRWVAFANESYCRHSDAIHELGYINWEMRSTSHFAIGDTVYLFMSDERRVRFKMVVVDRNCARTDSAYWIKKAPTNLTYKLSLANEYHGDQLKEIYLKKYGFSGNCIQNPSCNNTDLTEYIDSVFTIEHTQESDLQCKQILYVDMNSGRYWQNNIGHEYFNLDKNPVDGRYYGYCPPDGNINITKLGAQKSDKAISGVIVVYTSKIKNSSDREIIAFCKNATIHRSSINEKKILQKLKRKFNNSSIEYCPYSIDSDELTDLRPYMSKFVIRVADYNPYMFRAQRFFKGSYKELDKKVIAYITNYLNNGNDDDELNYYESIQNADVDINLADTAKEMPEYIDGNNCKVVKKKSKITKSVLANSKYRCVADNSHITFNTAKGDQYMEGHHLIPCTYSNAQYFWKTKGRNIDCAENIVCLCPTCHRKIHFGSSDEKRVLIKLLYEKQITKLSDANIAISLDELYALYGV